MVQTFLVTGFEPFGDWESNPSADVASALDGWIPAEGWIVRGRHLPVDLARLDGVLRAVTREVRPAAIVHVGLNGQSSQIAVERVGINVADFTLPDNAGQTIQDQPLVTGAPAAYFSTLPVRSIVGELVGAGIPAHLSSSAGTYLCNAALYLSLHAAAQQGSAVRRAGFIHIPPQPGQVAARRGAWPSMCFDLVLDAVRRAVRISSQGWES